MHHQLDMLPDGGLFIDGRRVADSSGGRRDHINPSTGSVTRDFALAGVTEVDQAVAAARRALPGWRALPPAQRRTYLLRIADEFERRVAQHTPLIVVENGMLGAFAGFVGSAVPAEWFRYYAGWVDKFGGATPPSLSGASFSYTLHEPFGVIACLIAFNAPMGFVGMKVPAALAAGNTVVLKPSELAPWSALAFADICEAVGLPPGVVNVVPGEAEAGNALVTHPGVDKISFTGGGPTASRILAAAAPSLKPVSLELGGKSATMIFDDADLEASVTAAIHASITQQAGQACIAGTRVLLQRGVYERGVKLLTDIARGLNVGDPFEAGTNIGPIISEHHRGRIDDMVTEAARGPARVTLRGGRKAGDGFFLKPSVIADVDPASMIAQEEVFGPVLAVIPFDSDEDAIRIANDSRYGLAGYVFTRSLDRAMRAVRNIETGTVAVNSLNYLPVNLPFGGFKASGFGREGGYEGIAEMARVKAVQIAVPAPGGSAA